MQYSLSGRRASGALYLLAGFVALTALAVYLWLPAIPQDPAYHAFADRRDVGGIPNFFDVASNLGFLWVGLAGLGFALSDRAGNGRVFLEPGERWIYFSLFLGVVLTGLGSAYYHLAPDNGRLVWDRLPMTILFMSLFAAIIAERIDVKAGLYALLPLLALGMGSVVYWHLGEQIGQGDLRLYGMVQFLPLLLMPLLLLFFPPRYTGGAYLLIALVYYGLAKLCETFDAVIYSMGELVSGHTLKHLLAALAVYWLLRMIRSRRPFPDRYVNRR